MNTHAMEIVHQDAGKLQFIYRFDNNRGVSVLYSMSKKGKAAKRGSMAVLKFTGQSVQEFEVDYSTPVTSKIMPNLTHDTLEIMLKKVKGLPPLGQKPKTQLMN